MRTSIARIPSQREVSSKSQLLSTIISMKCNSFSVNFISAKSSLIQGEILVPIPNISSIVCPISPNCRRQWCEKPRSLVSANYFFIPQDFELTKFDCILRGTMKPNVRKYVIQKFCNSIHISSVLTLLFIYYRCKVGRTITITTFSTEPAESS